MNRTENNKLIAEFMDYPTSCDYWKDGRYEEEDDYYYVDGYYDPVWSSSNFHLDDMNFDLCWKWIMPLVKTIKDTPTRVSLSGIDYVLTCDLTIDNLYKEVVDFIKKYNEEKN